MQSQSALASVSAMRVGSRDAELAGFHGHGRENGNDEISLSHASTENYLILYSSLNFKTSSTKF